MVTPRKSFDELKKAFIAAMPVEYAPGKIDFAAMKSDLIRNKQEFDKIANDRTFTTDALMRSYTL